MKINNVEFVDDPFVIITELQKQMRLKNLPYLYKIIDGPSNVQVCCPYHKNGQERRPSAGIKKSTGVFHCFACGEKHSLPEMISYCFEQNDVMGGYGWNWLIRNFLTLEIEERKEIELDYERSGSGVHNRGPDRNPNDISSNRDFISDEELDQYRWYHPYWAERGIKEDWVIELFDLGYDKATKSITFPVRDIEGHCLFIARRNVHTKFFNYPEGVKKPLYGLYELYKESVIGIKCSSTHKIGIPGSFPTEVLVCESMIDCILLWQAGHYAVALNGLGNDLQFKQLMSLPCRKLILCTDNDKAGDNARDRIKSQVKGKIFSEIIFPEGIKDVGECSKEQIRDIMKWEEYV